MAKKKAAKKPWTSDDVKSLKKLAGKSTLPQIAKQLKRTAGAVQQKASSESISLALRK